MTTDQTGQATRRRFLCATTAVAAAALGPAMTGETVPATAGSALRQVRKTTRALGAKVSITALHTDGEIASRAIDAAFAELQQVESLLSIYRMDSQVSQLNQRHVLVDPHPYFVQVLRQAEQISRQSGGAFDVTVQPLWSLLASAKRVGCMPSDEQVTAACQRVDWRGVEVSPSQIRLRPGTAITLNGIAQGFAADRVATELRAHGVTNALIDTGEFSALGEDAESDAWKIGVQHPRRKGALISAAKVAGRCLATSGDYATSFSEDHRSNHLFDPRSGRSPAELCSVTVVAGTGMMADALSTAVFVLGVKKGLALVKRIAGADALLIGKSGKLHATAGFPFHV